jgi:hypothetical protein
MAALPMMTAAIFFSFLFVLSSASCQSVQALASFHVFRLHHPTLLQNRERNYRPNHRFDSRNSINRSNNIFSGVGYYYTSSPFYDGNDEMTSPKNNNHQLWQLLHELRQGLNKNNNCNNNKNNNNYDNDGYCSSTNDNNDEAFQRVIQSLYRESQMNIQHLEKEIEALRQTLQEDTPIIGYGGRNYNDSSFSFQQSLLLFQAMIQEDIHINNNSSSNKNTNINNCSSSSSSINNTDVDEIISNEVLKAVFVGYQWTEYDKKRLSSAHPQDYHL